MRRRLAVPASVALGAVALLAGCSGSGGTTSSDGPIELTMWTRSVTAEQSEALVDAFNAENEGEIEIALTVVPFDQYLQKVGAAASSDDLPDLLAANVVDGPNYTRTGLWTDVTDRVAGLDFADALAPSHIEAATLDDAVYAVPHVTDVSSIYYNKVLFTQAGLDPEAPPETLEELAEDAATIAASGGGAGGLYLPGDCGGCLAFTLFPSIWAADGTVMNEDGTEATLDSPEAEAVFEVYHEMFENGSMIPESRNEKGPTQNAAFEAGTAGFALLGSKAIGTLAPSDRLDIGIAPISAPDGGSSTFVGGDVLGISSSSDQVDAAWEFVEWTLQEEQQLSTFAENGFLTVRTDLADNEFASADPRLVLLNELIAEGQTPYSARFFQTFNDPTGPWVALVREAIFGAGPSSLGESNDAVTASLEDQ